jgi:hypothetical protein
LFLLKSNSTPDSQLQAERARNDELQVRLQALEARIEALE